VAAGVSPVEVTRPFPTRSLAVWAGVVVFLAAVSYLVILPLVRLQMKALAGGARGYRIAYTDPAFATTLGYTVGLALGSLAIALVLGTALAWAASRLPRRLRILRVLPIFPIIVPAVASIVGWSFLFSPRPGYLNALLRNLPWWSDLREGPVDIYTLPWIVIITGFGLTAFVYLFVSSGFANISSEHVEAAQVAGSSQWGVFFRVTLPLLRPTLIYGGGVALLLGLGQFTGPLLLGRNAGIEVITTDIYRQMSATPIEYGAAAALATPLLVFGILIVLVQKVLLGDQRRFVTHGGKAFKSEAKPSYGGAVGIVAYSFIATVLPIIGLVIVSLSRFWSAKVDVAHFSLQSFRTLFEKSAITQAIFNSVTISLLAVAICLPVGYIVSSILLRGQRYGILRTILDYVVSMPLGIPAVVFGAGFLLTYTRGPFVLYGTNWVIVLVYVTLMLPFSVRMQASAMLAIGDNYSQAARVSGSGVIGTSLKVELPLMRSAIGGAAALMFVLLTHEFAASLLVRASTTQVMGTILYDYYNNGTYPLVAAIALIMTLVTAIGVTIAMMIGGSDALGGL
jgi:iron(III) transport system permease protein